MNTNDWNAKNLLQLSGGYWAGCALQAAVQLDIFTALAEGPRDEPELAAALGCEARSFSMLATALAALGLLRREDGKLAAPGPVLALLSRASPDYVGFIISHHAHLMPAWTRLAETVRAGRPETVERVSRDGSDEERQAFLLGMFNIARLQAEKIAQALDLSGKSTLIDVGGGPGTYAVYFCKKNPGLKATIFDLPTTEPFARKIVADYGLEGRIGFAGGDFLAGPLPAGQDVAWLSQVLHGETPANAAKLLQNAAACLKRGGLLCVQEFALNDDRGGPAHAALFSLNMLLRTEGGQAYTEGEIAQMMRSAGALDVHALEVELPNACRVLLGQMP
jgi:SAM-dependent methyltransferase